MPESLEAFWSEPGIPIEIATPARALPLLTNSRANTYADCPKRHHLAYNLGYRPVGKNFVLQFGHCAHYGMEAWWKPGVTGDDRLTVALEYIDRACTKEKFNDFDRIRAEECIRGYHYRWVDIQDRSIETTAVEQQFRVPLIHPVTGERSQDWDLGGMIDKLAIVDLRPHIVEHKTSSEDFGPGSDYQQRTLLSTQVSQYYRAAKDMGYDIVGCLYDVMRRPGQLPLKATPVELRRYTKATKKDPSRLYSNQRDTDETPEEYRLRIREHIADNPELYYQRWTVVRLPSEELEAAVDIWNLGAIMSRSARDNAHPRFVKSCKQFGSACAYLGVCSGYSSLDDKTKFEVVENVNQELSVE